MKFARSLTLILSLAVPTGVKPSGTLHTIINGSQLPPEIYPEVMRIRSAQGECTATLVGPKVVLTAAHCVGDTESIEKIRGRPPTPFPSSEMDNPFGDPDPEEVIARGFEILGNCMVGQMPVRGRCWQHPLYSRNRHDMDFALCLLADEQAPPYAAIARHPVFRNDFVQLLGFGCKDEDGSGAGLLRGGLSRVSRLPYRDAYFGTDGRAALCYGDSGGPVMRVTDDESFHEVVGVNSRGDLRTRSLFSAVYLPSVRSWMRDFGKRHGVIIEGLGRLEKRVRFDVPDRDQLDAEEMLGS